MLSNVLKMKELEARTGVNREAIRFYIREGILPQPHKPQKNVAHYSEEHVLRIRLIKKLQEERFMPLGRIKDVLESSEFSELATISNLAEFEFAFTRLVTGESITSDMPLDELTKVLGFSLKEIQKMHDMEIIQLKGDKGSKYVDRYDFGILEKWSKIKALGYEDEMGYDISFLNRYVAITNQLASMEVSQFFNAFGAESVEDSAQRGAKGVQFANELLGQLHTRAVRARVSEYVNLSNKDE